jgi:hypothetical protein
MKHCKHLLFLLCALIFGSTPASAQKLISVSPANGSTGASIFGPVTFTFDVDMQPTVSGETTGPIYWGANPDRPFRPLVLQPFFYRWTTPRTLEVYPVEHYGGLPKNATITWELNTMSGLFRSTSGSFLRPSDQTSGSFETANQAWGEYRAGAALLTVEKRADHEQVSAAAPKLIGGTPFSFRASVEADESLGLTNVSISRSGLAGTSQTLEPLSPKHFELLTWSGSATGLHAMYPLNYSTLFRMEAPGTLWMNSCSLATTNFPAAPFISNFMAAQEIDAAQSFIVELGPGGVSTNQTRILIRDAVTREQVLETPEWHGESPLGGDVTDFVVPAGTLSAGRTYEIEISRWSGTVAAIPGEERTTMVAISSVTKTQLKTVAESVVVSLFNPSYSPGIFSVEAALAANESYSLQRTTNATTWETVSSEFVGSSSHTFVDATAPVTNAVYRVKKD